MAFARRSLFSSYSLTLSSPPPTLAAPPPISPTLTSSGSGLFVLSAAYTFLPPLLPGAADGAGDDVVEDGEDGWNPWVVVARSGDGR